MCMRNAQSDVGQQAVTGFTPAVLPNRLRIYVYTRIYTRVHVRVHIASSPVCARVPACIYICAHTHASTAILRRSANQWRNCKPVHPRGPSVVHAAWISNLSPPLISSFFPFFSLNCLPPFHWLPPTLRLNFLYTANPGYEEDLN